MIIANRKLGMGARRIFNSGIMRSGHALSGFAAILAVLSAVFCVNPAGASPPDLRGGPVVAIHDSELTRALETMPATNPGTPTGPGASGFEWWPTNWHYFV